MNIKRTIVWIVVWLLTVAAWGTPRSEQQIRSAAVRALANVDAGAAGSAKRVGRQVRTLQESVGLVVMGYADGGFAVIAKDDVFPAVLGYSSTVFDPDTRNSNFKWWLQAMEEVTRRMPQTLKLRLSPADYGFAPRVKPLVKTAWGQSYPFNM